MNTPSTASKTAHIVGIDVSQNTLDVCILPSAEIFQVSNDTAGVKALKTKLLEYHPQLIVLEATGGLERRVHRSLEGASYRVARVNPRHPRAFAIANGQRAKTDRIDALMLAQYGSRLNAPVRTLPSEQLETLAALMKRRDVVKRLIANEKKRLSRAVEAVMVGMKELIVFLEAQVKQLDLQAKAILEADPALKARAQLLQSVPGVGFVTSSVLISSFSELGSLSAGEAASLAGLAPFARDSGKKKGQRFIGGGRAIVRCALFMAAVTARRFAGCITALFERLKAKGKPYKVCVIACARALLVMLNAMVRSGKPFDAEFGRSHA
jgi:transposase